MHPKYFRFTNAVVFTGVLALSACFGGPSKTPATRYYLLHPMESMVQGLAALKGTTIGMGPIKLSQSLDRPQIIVRTSHNEIRVADLERWAGPLDENLANVMIDNLSVLLPGAEFIKFPWQVSIPITYQLIMDITRFDGMPGDESVLRARWGILSEGGKKVLANKQSVISEPIQGNTIAEMVSAQSRLLAAFSREIAGEIKRLQEQSAGQ